jgi:oxygen-dependent protoporphyrinogen oxidase
LNEQDTPIIADYYHKAHHTKVTVMMGGPYPVIPLPPKLVSSDDEDAPPLVRCILDDLKVHLSRDLPNPIYWRFWNNEACIPTFLPGHLDRMEEVEAVLRDSPEWGSRLAVIGAGVGGVSIIDCIEAARRVGRDWM